ncbi:MAG: methyltransferase domain-containing protein [Bryobacteraceae bacterium]|nr:methyltransferase domain-containing protein [Bryobacteraceae bacterium]MDW8378503.1 protein arginine N-methyltransferase [Bryobacterales bacterium]
MVDQGRYLEAIPVLTEIVATKPCPAVALFWMGHCCYLTGGPGQEALDYYASAERYGYCARQVNLYRGIVLAESERYSEALEAFRTAQRSGDERETKVPAKPYVEQLERILAGRASPTDFYFPPPHLPHLNGTWLEEASVPQSQQFMIDCLPALRKLFGNIGKSPIRLLDVGTATGAGANVIATLYAGSILGYSVKVDAIDLIRRYRAYARRAFPRVNYLCGDLFRLPETDQWDITVCSHTIEHLADPTPLIEECQRRAAYYALFYAPFEEKQLIPGHWKSVDEEFVLGLNPLWWEIGESPGWKHPHDEISRTVLFVLRGKARVNR